MKTEDWALLLSLINACGGIFLFFRSGAQTAANIRRDDFLRDGWTPLNSALDDFHQVLCEIDTMCRVPATLNSDQLTANTIKFHKSRQRISDQLNFLADGEFLEKARWREGFEDTELEAMTELLEKARQALGTPDCLNELSQAQKVGKQLISRLRSELNRATREIGTPDIFYGLKEAWSTRYSKD